MGNHYYVEVRRGDRVSGHGDQNLRTLHGSRRTASRQENKPNQTDKIRQIQYGPTKK